MIPLKLKRQHLRAPLVNECLFIDEGTFFKGTILNISEGGGLLSDLNFYPDSKQFSLFFDLPILPDFSTLPASEIFSLDKNNFEHQIYGTLVESRRNFEAKLDDGKRIKKMGAEFIDPSKDVQEGIKKYVSTFSINIIYVLSLFEQGHHRKAVSDLIRKVISLLNYDGSLKLSVSRQIVLHDYQSLESL